MRVLFVDQFTEWGGAQIGLRDIALEGKRRGWRISVMAPGHGPLRTFCESHGFPVDELPLSTFANGHKTTTDVLRFGPEMIRCARTIRRAVRTHRITLV